MSNNFTEVHRPQVGDKFWDQNVFVDNKEQPNGRIVWISWEDREVVVQFYDTRRRQSYSFEEIEDYYYPDLFGGIYMIRVHLPKSSLSKKS